MNKEEKCKELLNKIKQTPDNVIEEAIDSLSEKMDREEIEKAKEDLSFMNEGDYITEEMEHSADIIEDYIEELEQKETILDKVKELANKIATKNAEKYNSENQKEVDFSEWNLALEILNIIEGDEE